MHRILDLTKAGAQWMGTALKILRPELQANIPPMVFKILGSSAYMDELNFRTVENYSDNPLDFFA